jgi:hypothetical protein
LKSETCCSNRLTAVSDGQENADEAAAGAEPVRLQDLLSIVKRTHEFAKTFDVCPDGWLEIRDLPALDRCELDYVIPDSEDGGEEGRATIRSHSAIRRHGLRRRLVRDSKA